MSAKSFIPRAANTSFSRIPSTSLRFLFVQEDSVQRKDLFRVKSCIYRQEAQADSLARFFNGNSFVLLYAFHLLFTVEGTKLLHPSLWHFSIAVAFIWHPSCRSGATCLSPPPSPLHHFPHYWFPLVVCFRSRSWAEEDPRDKGFLL